MFSDIPGLDRAQTKNEIRDRLLVEAFWSGHPLSKSKANNLADKYKKGMYDPELQRIINYSDPVGEQAVNNVLKEQVAS